jgi:hypothetical protein
MDIQCVDVLLCYRKVLLCYLECVTGNRLGYGLGYRLLCSHSHSLLANFANMLANLATYYPRVRVYARI